MIEKSKFTDYFAPENAGKLKSSHCDDIPTKKPKRGSRYERHRVARIMAIQAFFEAQHNHIPAKKMAMRYMAHNFKNHTHPVNPDQNLFLHILTGVEIQWETIQDLLEPMVMGHWTIETLDPLLKTILSLGIGELLTPYTPSENPLKPTVIISEYIEITKGFYEDKEAAYVNKALDEIYKIISKNS